MLVAERALAEFFPLLAREKYRYQLTAQLSQPLARFYEPYSDILTPATLASLRQELAATDPYFDTKHCQLNRLIHTLTELYLSRQALPLINEILQTQQQISVSWQGQPLPYAQIDPILTTLSAASARRALYRQYRQATRSLESLYQELITKTQLSIKSLTNQSLPAFALSPLAVDADVLTAQATTILSATENSYRPALAKYSSTYLSLPVNQLHQADCGYWQSLTPFASWLNHRATFAVYQETLAGLAIKLGKLPNLRFVTSPTMANWSNPLAVKAAANRALISCQAVQIPQEVYLFANTAPTPGDLAQLLGSLGQALFYSFTATDLAPTFKYPADHSLELLYYHLFANLVANPLWLAQMFGTRPWPALQQAFTLIALYRWRATAAQFLEDQRLDGQQVVVPETAAAALTAATGITVEADLYWQNHTNLFSSAAQLQAILGESLLREYLLTHYGWRWWTNPRAGNLLQEIWATGSRYSLASLSSQLGIGTLQPDSLIATVNQILKS